MKNEHPRSAPPGLIAGNSRLIHRAEELIATLQGVLSVQVVPNDTGAVDEIHVLTTDAVLPKQTVRNIESALMAQLGLRINSRKIAIATTLDTARATYMRTPPLSQEGDRVRRPVFHGGGNVVTRGGAQRTSKARIASVLSSVLTHAGSFAALNALEPLERADAVEAGVPASMVNLLALSLGAGKDKICALLGISRATVDRRAEQGKPLTPADSEPVLGLARLLGQVEQVVQESGDPTDFELGAWVARFLEESHPALGGRRPGDLMRTSDGRAVVTTLVAQMQSGAYA